MLSPRDDETARIAVDCSVAMSRAVGIMPGEESAVEDRDFLHAACIGAMIAATGFYLAMEGIAETDVTADLPRIAFAALDEWLEAYRNPGRN